jgi:hypothetical protein
MDLGEALAVQAGRIRMGMLSINLEHAAIALRCNSSQRCASPFSVNRCGLDRSLRGHHG